MSGATEIVERCRTSGEGLMPERRVSPRRSRMLTRRRRIVAALTTALIGSLTLATTWSGPTRWWLPSICGVVLVGYATALLRLQHLCAEREMAHAFSSGSDGGLTWPPIDLLAADQPRPGRQPEHGAVAPGRLLDRWSVSQYVWAAVAGWLLELVVSLSDRLLGDPTKEGGRRRVWLRRSDALQSYLRRQSQWALSASAGATASVVVASSMAAPASASPGAQPVAAAMAPFTGAGGTSATTYTVVAGDTLGAIAGRFGTSVASLVADNHIADPDLILVGQVLNVSRPGGIVPAPVGSNSGYTVVPGDTLAGISARFSTSVDALAAANHIADPDLIFVGQVLVIGATAPPAPPAPTAHAVPPAPPVAITSAAGQPGGGLPLPGGYLHGGWVDQGVDYGAPGGTPLYAMGTGTIIMEGINGFGPNTPVLRIESGRLAGWTVYYGHAGQDLVGVGAHVVEGQQISSVGYGIVGISEGPHLEVGFYPLGGNGAGITMRWYLDHLVGHSTG